MAPAKSKLRFQAAVERPFSGVFCTRSGGWEGHDYLVEIVAEREGLDAMDVVVDFRDLEAALDRWLAPLDGLLLPEAGIGSPSALAQRLLDELAPQVPPPARIARVTLTDGRGCRISVTPLR